MEARGIISEYEGSKPRKVLITKEQWQEQKMQMEKFESKMILEALKQADGNQAKAARMLGMSRSTFWRKLNAISHNG